MREQKSIIDDLSDEARIIRDVLHTHLPQKWDGRKSILALREVDYNWRQMEWIGWYLEYFGREALMAHYGGDDGPRYGKTTFDYQNRYVWDFKAHPSNSPSSKWAVMNDCEAVDRCIAEYGGIGFIIALGEADYNSDQRDFYIWHKELKSGMSNYEKERVARGAPSRRRKVAFSVEEYITVFFKDRSQVEQALQNGWLDYFQKNMRNADGSPRRAKYKINLGISSDRLRV